MVLVGQRFFEKISCLGASTIEVVALWFKLCGGRSRLLAVLVCVVSVGFGCSSPNPTSQSASSQRSDTSTSNGGSVVAIDDQDPKPERGDGTSLDPDPKPVAEELTLTGAEVLQQQDFDELSGKRVGLITNQVSVVNGVQMVDLLAEADQLDLVAIFAPEHGWRGTAGAGEQVLEEIDPNTGLPVFSLYSDTREPTAAMLTGIDVLVFDLQDVGARYYTYISTMGLAMKAAAENDVAFMVLDRPNPLGGLATDGPIRSSDQESFVSQYPIPTLHGLTTGELAMAIVGEGWLPGLENLDLTVVEMQNWKRAMLWSDTGLDWIAPSPGLPTERSALTYPATVQFEATTMSYGRGTDLPFSQIGAPWIESERLAQTLNAKTLAGVEFEPTQFTPEASPAAENPQYEGVDLPGIEIRVTDPTLFEPTTVGVHVLEAVLDQANAAGEDPLDRPGMFDLLAGTSDMRKELQQGRPAAEIVAQWQPDLVQFDQVRQTYEIYD